MVELHPIFCLDAGTLPDPLEEDLVDALVTGAKVISCSKLYAALHVCTRRYKQKTKMTEKRTDLTAAPDSREI